jgi:hypothetical protein
MLKPKRSLQSQESGSRPGLASLDYSGSLDALLYPEERPLSTRGAINTFPCSGQSVSLDWVQGSLRLKDARKVGSYGTPLELVSDVRRLVAFNMDAPEAHFQVEERRNHTFRRLLAGPGGAEIWFDNEDEDGPEVHWKLPGKAARMCGTKGAVSLVSALQRRGASWSRLDGALDDYDKVVSIADALEWSYPDRYGVTRMNKRKPVFEYDRHRNLTVEMFTLGVRGSRQYLRYYNKDLESGGEQKCYRWEMELRDKAAEMLAVQITAAGLDGFGDVVRGRLRQIIDYREPTSIHTERRPLCAWWAILVGDAKKLPGYLPVLDKTFLQSVAWFKDTLAPMVHTFVKGFEGDVEFFYEMIRDGESRIKAKHRRLLASVGVYA